MAKQGRSRIINAAFYLFLKHGYKGVSLKDIIQTSQLSKGAIYHHFESKYAIYLTAVEEYFFKLLAAEFIEDAHLTIQQRMRSRYEHFVNFIEFVETLEPDGIPFPIRAFYVFQLDSEQDAFILERVRTAMEDYRKEITQLVQTAIDKKEIEHSLPAPVIGQQLMSMMEGLAVHHSAVEKNCKEFLIQKYEEVITSYLDLITTKKNAQNTIT